MELRTGSADKLVAAWSMGVSPQDLSRFNAYLGISFSKTQYFSRPMMAAYIDWACARFQHLLIIIADHLEAHNQQIFRRISLEEAERRTEQKGQELKIGYDRAIPDVFRKFSGSE